MQDTDYINFKIFDLFAEKVDKTVTSMWHREFRNKYRYDAELDALVKSPDGRQNIDLGLINASIPQNLKDIKKFTYITNHAFEPIFYDIDKIFWETCKNYTKNSTNKYADWYMLHGELSNESSWLSYYNFKPVHFFGNGILATHWYRLYNGITMYTDYKPIKYRFICANRLIDERRKYRIKFLNLIDVSKGVYSLLESDPQTNRTVNEIMPGNQVVPNSFDDHDNSSAWITVRKTGYQETRRNTPFYYTEWATSFLHVVPETMIDRVHLTEKIFKPIVLKQPFVLLCGTGALNYLKGYGFKTFDGFWSEEYDNIQDEDKRLQAVADIVNRIGKMTLAECKQMRDQMKPILEHNYNWFYNGFADCCWNELRDNIQI